MAPRRSATASEGLILEQFVKNILIYLSLFVLAVMVTIALGFVSSQLFPEWMDLPIQIALVAFAYWLMGKLIDIFEKG
jgi:uncharacterized integral membrane protein